MVMSVWAKKMWRTIRHTKAQFFAMAVLVMLGTAVYVSMSTAYYNLDRTKDVFYRETRFADYCAPRRRRAARQSESYA